MKRIISLILTACLLCSLFVSVASAVVYPSVGRTREANVRLRETPDPKGKKVAQFSKKGYELTVEGEEEVDGVLWYQVTTPKGKTGYVQGIYLSVEDNDYIEAVEESKKGKVMNVTVTGRCDDYKGLGKKYTEVFEVNGLRLAAKKPTVTIAEGEEFSYLSYLSNKNAAGTEKSTYTPTAADMENGFSVTQTVTCISFKTQKEIVWVMTWTFMPPSAKEAAAAKDSKTSQDSKAGSSTGANYSGSDISYDLTSSGDKPATAVKREIDHYEEKEMEVTERVVVGYKTYIAYEVDEKGKAKEVEKQKPVYELQKVKKMVKVPVYKDEMPADSTTTTDTTDTTGTSKTTDSTGTEEDTELPEEEEEYPEEEE